MEAIPFVASAGASLFGKAGGQSQQSTTTPVDMTRPEFRQLGLTAAGGLGNFIGGGPAAARPYSGPLTAPAAANELATLGAGQATAVNPFRANLINETLAGNFLPGQAGGNPFLQAAITQAQRPTMQALEQAMGRTIPGQFLAAGHQRSGNSALEYALARQGEIGGTALADIATGIGSQAYNAERALQSQAIGLSQQDIQAMTANLQLQGLPRLLQQNDITSAINLGQQGIGNWLQGLQIGAGYPIQPIAQRSQATSTTNPNLMSGMFGNAGLFGWALPKGIA